jgi:hypothetical protein
MRPIRAEESAQDWSGVEERMVWWTIMTIVSI